MTGVDSKADIPRTENPAIAGFQLGDYRPKLAVPGNKKGGLSGMAQAAI